MTRQEAVDRVAGLPWNSPGGIVTTLEALGLLKFDEEKKDLTEVIYRARMVCQDSSISQKQFIDYLATNGYKIVKEQS